MNIIGVAADPTEYGAVEEFFELFKTPWERAVPSRHYQVVLSTVGPVEGLSAERFLIYSSGDPAPERLAAAGSEQVRGPVRVDWAGTALPIYGRLALFDAHAESRLRYGTRAADCCEPGRPHLQRIGYDLFKEVEYLLTEGQPASTALTPTLELHIELLRRLLLDAGISFVEVPPRPDGYDFICCLTHDVDFYGIRRHRFDRTLAGFVARATLGTLLDVVRGRRTLRDAALNWRTTLSLPLVYLGLLPDFWRPFDDYRQVEDPRRSTFFLVPFKGKPGVAPDGSTDATRAVRYEIADIETDIRQAAARGSELAVHGIDAWRDSQAGRTEMATLTAVTGSASSGVRMHWLYFDRGAPRQLESAGFEYDSTCGFNDAVGYRAGTSQSFLVPGTRRFMELPLSIMDSALFDRMGLTSEEAAGRCREILANARCFGGTVVVNWHCRSLAPERLWHASYRVLLSDTHSAGRVWFATASEAVNWFRWRRSIRFQSATAEEGTIEVSAPPAEGPAAILRVHVPGSAPAAAPEHRISGETPIIVRLHDLSRDHA